MSEVLANNSVVPFVLGVVIGVPSVILYTIEAVVLLRNWSKFSSAFFRLCLVRFITLWKYFLPISVFIIFLLPIPFTCITWFYEFYVLRQPDNWTYTLYFDKADYLPFINVPNIAAIAGIVFCVCCLVLNIATIVIYRLNQRRIMALGSGKEKENRVEYRLTLYALITFAAQFLLAIYTRYTDHMRGQARQHTSNKSKHQKWKAKRPRPQSVELDIPTQDRKLYTVTKAVIEK
ncbi:serpentine type 7TM GPCR chemoreceptor srv domain-containing protein [Ditylenchus destructor]|uniref:Serpentine type 7TM GPCR chemoreceptor srv domain-containing protein n=1 Tax=Ditylenchus destructor TaxID=166010 RepID=A0AAD4MQI0_9BILA|nr:serpentine type 7TM GPCR chemoreceptor srv domain-containing protein [Ditylenchus destructor]